MRIGLFSLSLFVGAVGSELLLRAIDYRISSYGAQNGLKIQFDPEILYRNSLTPELQVLADGTRFTGGESLPDTTPQVLLLGDSFTFGAGVSAQDSFPALLQTLVGSTTHIINAGVIGYGPDQAVKLGHRYNTENISTVILTLYAGNDLHDIITNQMVECDRHHQCQWSSNNILSPYIKSWRILNLFRRAFFGKFAIPPDVIHALFDDRAAPIGQISEPQARSAMSKLQFILQEFENVSANAAHIVLIIPPVNFYTEREAYRLNVDSLAESCSRSKATCVTTSSVLEHSDFLSGDFHLNANGNRKVAGVVLDILNEKTN